MVGFDFPGFIVWISLNIADMNNTNLFYRLLSQRLDHFPSLSCFISAYDLSAVPIPILFDVTREVTH